jgi:hypothetical protein
MLVKQSPHDTIIGDSQERADWLQSVLDVRKEQM